MLFRLLALAHLGLLAGWLGSMSYSLVVVQPRATRFLAADDDTLEEFLTVLGAGNRRPVLAIVAGLFASLAALVVIDAPDGWRAALYGVEAALLVAAAAVFARVSWRLWPRRVFALPEERPAHRAVLRRHAVAIVALVGASFVAAVLVLARAG